MSYQPKASLRSLSFASAPRPLRLIPIIGTDGWDDGWAFDATSPLQRTFADLNVEIVRDQLGRVFSWYAGLEGLSGGKNRIWELGARHIYDYVTSVDGTADLPYQDLNFLAYSHGGQPIFHLAASGFPIRSVTFVGTPNRTDVPARAALPHIGIAQLIFDNRWDLMGTLGAWFDGSADTDRSFKKLGPRLLRYPRLGIGHGGVLKDQQHIALWKTEPWLDNIRIAAQDAA